MNFLAGQSPIFFTYVFELQLLRSATYLAPEVR